MNQDDINGIATSNERTNKMSLKLFGEKSSEFFEKRKSQLDQYIYSFIKVENSDLAQELFLKIEWLILTLLNVNFCLLGFGRLFIF